MWPPFQNQNLVGNFMSPSQSHVVLPSPSSNPSHEAIKSKFMSESNEGLSPSHSPYASSLLQNPSQIARRTCHTRVDSN